MPFSPFGRGITLLRGLTNHGYSSLTKWDDPPSSKPWYPLLFHCFTCRHPLYISLSHALFRVSLLHNASERRVNKHQNIEPWWRYIFFIPEGFTQSDLIYSSQTPFFELKNMFCSNKPTPLGTNISLFPRHFWKWMSFSRLVGYVIVSWRVVPLPSALCCPPFPKSSSKNAVGKPSMKSSSQAPGIKPSANSTILGRHQEPSTSDIKPNPAIRSKWVNSNGVQHLDAFGITV